MAELYDNPAAFYRENVRRSAKDRQCCECLRRIPAYRPFVHCVGKWESGFESFRVCENCHALRLTLNAMLEPEGFTVAFGEVWENANGVAERIN